ncbi:hypothetical protein VHEMI07726 [[Torrubiella] hemipterigena]|uniref:Conserved oligomeric Golgi complex subunit 1 n=1 Tax=[Torrubiella] hemipterigena TaxID=1531966 RepID=A0A0A1T4C3_9HYPO|nr:hypothetical protein VHEMI07726 [[Torrubiella] hemipterigena]
MATPEVDVSSLTTSANIFSGTNTLPQIRTINNIIRSHIDEISSRLRTQVGSSYRELLGTADAIVQMQEDNDNVQQLLARMGGKCGRTIVTNKSESLKHFKKQQSRPEMSVVARTKLLNDCVSAADTTLQGCGGLGKKSVGDRLLLSSKLLTLGRLLTASLQDGVSDKRVAQTTDAAKNTIERLRWKLRRGIDKVLEYPSEDSDRDDILKALCARSVASSSGAKDALRYLLDVRGKSIKAAFDTEEGERTQTPENTLLALKLYIRTILDVQALLPTTLPQALVALKQNRLLADTTLKQLNTLRLDLYESWCSEEIQFYTPFIRHDDLDGKTAREALLKWAEAASQDFINGLKETTDSISDFTAIIKLRGDVLQLWIRNGSKAKGFDPQELLDEIRETLNGRMLHMLEAKASKLHLVGSEIHSTLEHWQIGITGKQAGLWTRDGYEQALEQGATTFLEEVISRLYGRNDSVSKAFHSYLAWFNAVQEVKTELEGLTKQRWDNDFDEVEDEDTLESRQQTLSKDDPKLLQDRMDKTLESSYKALATQLSEVWACKENDKDASAVAAYLLRVIRDIGTKLPERPVISNFCDDIVAPLQASVASAVISSGTKDFLESGLPNRTVECRSLWDGEPALPMQPSPDTFNLLHSMSMKMSDTGIDLWTPSATKILKSQLISKLVTAWESELTKIEDSDTGSTDDASPTSDSTKPAASVNVPELCTQWLFDASLLQESLGSSDEFDKLVSSIYKRTQLDDEAQKKRITKATSAYWQRISMLFGLFTDA